MRLFFFNVHWRETIDGLEVGPDSTQGFREIRFFSAQGWETWEVSLFRWVFVIAAIAGLWEMDRARAGGVRRAAVEHEPAAR